MSRSPYVGPPTRALLGLRRGGFLNSTLCSTRNLEDNTQLLTETEQQRGVVEQQHDGAEQQRSVEDVDQQRSVDAVDIYNEML